MERIQLVGFCLQEFIISSVYITSTVRLLGSIYHSMTRKVMFQLILINGICIGMDITLIGLQFSGEYVGEAACKPMIYAIKLKLEFAVLNQLMGLTKAGFTEENQHRGGEVHGSHELQNRTLATKTDPESGCHTERKIGTWTTASKGLRGSFSGGNGRMSVSNPEQIFQTQHVDIISEPMTGKDTSNASSATAVTSGETTQQQHPPQSKVKSLMGTPIVHMPGRARHRPTDPDGRTQSPSESEEELRRKSSDSEKEGTRWIDGPE